TVGMDPVTGYSRFGFGHVEVLKGIGLIPLLIGLFAISEILEKTEAGLKEKLDQTMVDWKGKEAENRLPWWEFKRYLPTVFRGAALGTFLGAIPGLGSTVTAFINYGIARRRSPHPERFGQGEPEGVAAAEAGNSAVVGATLIPLLSLGIPGDIITAVLLGAFMIQGITPGPTMFTEHVNIVYALFIGLMVCNAGNLLIGTFSIKAAKNVLRIPKTVLYPVILTLCFVGTYAVDNSLFDVQVMFGFGILGYVMRKFNYPLAPLLIAFVLGPMLENSLRQALIISDGNWGIFVRSPIAAFFLGITLVTVVLIAIRLARGKREGDRVETTR
ncbi:MAG: tripartite tricarboxylate transporter permease, partial [Desulfobacterales bacterium]|nr:tripartite tricarboxylate transporter permease [Desulfobacterales bacterium]